MSSNIVVLNPYTPLAFLPPDLADLHQGSCYVIVAGLSAFVWDWIMSISEEYIIFRRSRLSVPTVAYIMSRVGTMGFCVGATVFQVASVANCQTLEYVIGSFYALGLSSTSLLFLSRVRAVYGNSKIITAIFGSMWVATLGLSIIVPLSVDSEHIGLTNKCMKTDVRSFSSVPIVFNAVYDTFIFLAITCRIISYAIVRDSKSSRARSFFRGDGLPRLSKDLLQSGQLYYFATIWLNIIFAIMILIPTLPAIYHSMFAVPNLALENAMACRVYRAVQLGFIKDPESTHYGNTVESPNSAPKESHCELAFKCPTLDESRNMHVIVNITQTTDMDIDDGHILGQRELSVEEGSDVCDQAQEPTN